MCNCVTVLGVTNWLENRLMNKSPSIVSYDILLIELATRLLSGKSPQNKEYFADLIFNLEANHRSLQRRIFAQQNGLVEPSLSQLKTNEHQ